MACYLDTLVHGDCLNVLPQIQSRSISFILTDPPYLARYKSRDGRTIPNDDNDAWLKPAFAEMFRVLYDHSYAVVFYGWPHADKFLQASREAGFHVVGHLVFPKGYSSNRKAGHVKYQHECAYLLAKGHPIPRGELPDVLPWVYTGNKLHPTQKPVSILRSLVAAFCTKGGTVLDPFAGSGSSLVAASQLGRHWIGIELDPIYHAIARDRLASASL